MIRFAENGLIGGLPAEDEAAHARGMLRPGRSCRLVGGISHARRASIPSQGHYSLEMRFRLLPHPRPIARRSRSPASKRMPPYRRGRTASSAASLNVHRASVTSVLGTRPGSLGREDDAEAPTPCSYRSTGRTILRQAVRVTSRSPIGSKLKGTVPRSCGVLPNSRASRARWYIEVGDPDDSWRRALVDSEVHVALARIDQRLPRRKGPAGA